VETFFSTGRDQIAELVSFLNSNGMPPLKGRALDFGCGVGRLTRPLASHVEECVGVDLSESMVHRAKQYHKDEPKCRFQVNESNDLSSFEAETFDVVFSSIVLQHMWPEMALKYIAEFVRVLKRGGLAVFQVPTRPSSLRSVLRSRLPFLAKAYLAVKRTGYPKLDLYHIPRSQVEHAVSRAGGIVSKTRRSPVAGEMYESHEFFVTKQ
jgi:ubiquinone/menaquinone biosynthesis C-methylase UbiE